MEDLSERVADLSPEKRELLKRLFEQEGLPVPSVLPQEEESVSNHPSGSVEGGKKSDTVTKFDRDSSQSSAGQGIWLKEETFQWYDLYHEQINSTLFGTHSFFMNLGYVANENSQYSRIELPNFLINKNSVKLALEAIGDCDITNCNILDIGCGRGGTINVIRKYFGVKTTTGVDISSGAISFCDANHVYPNTWFVRGDAERLPFKNAAFDVITNVESSHSYPNMLAFYGEVFRVLKAGGYFLYTDLFPVDGLYAYRKFLRSLGLTIERDQDITSNVLSSCDETAGNQFQAFGKDNHDEVMANALGVPGSETYDDMKNGRRTFRILKLLKT